MNRAIYAAGIALAVWLLGAVVIVVAVPPQIDIGDGLVFWTFGIAVLAFILWKERG